MDHAASIIAYRTTRSMRSCSLRMGLTPLTGHVRLMAASIGEGAWCCLCRRARVGGALLPRVGGRHRPAWGKWRRRNTVVANWIVNGFVSALAMVLLLRLLVASGFGGRSAVFAVIGIGLGTTYYPYATSFYAHNLTANLGIAALFVLFAARPSPARDALAGVLVGFAVMCDYSAAHAVPVVGAALLAVRQRAIVPFVIGGLLPAAALAAYHTAVFGGPFLTAYTFQNPEFEPSQRGLFALPKLRTLLSLTVGPYRGVFFSVRSSS